MTHRIVHQIAICVLFSVLFAAMPLLLSCVVYRFIESVMMVVSLLWLSETKNMYKANLWLLNEKQMRKWGSLDSKKVNRGLRIINYLIKFLKWI